MSGRSSTARSRPIPSRFTRSPSARVRWWCSATVFPESWYSWRHQLPAVSAAGFRAVALDMRGYGGTTAPPAVADYSLGHLVGDVGAVAALGEKQAVVVGHDWGAPVAWYSALMRPEVFRAVVGMSVPYIPPVVLPAGLTMSDLVRAVAGPKREYYRLYFQELGVAEKAMEADVERTVRGLLYSISGDVVTDSVFDRPWYGHFPPSEGLMSQLVVPEVLPPWLTEDDVRVYVDELSRSIATSTPCPESSGRSSAPPSPHRRCTSVVRTI